MKSPVGNLVIATALLTIVESKSNLQRAENVFGWQDKSSPRRSHHISQSASQTRSSPRRSENVFNWQQQQHDPRVITHTSSKGDTSQDSTNPLNIIQPRKKELWLPWPLGELRNDYNRFAEQQKHRLNSSQQQQQQQQQQQKQQRISEYYSDPAPNHSWTQQGKEFMSKLFQRGQSLTQPRRHDTDERSGYWIKETTTPMATASASMKEEKSKKKLMRGGGKANEHQKKYDHEMLLQYFKLQMKVRLRQLGYVGSDFSVHLPPASPALLLLYMLPSTQDPLRRLIKFSVTTATISWMHSEATKYRRFAPLPIMQGMNVRRPDLLPFLPEVLNEKAEDATNKEKQPVVENNANNTLHALWDPFQSFGTVSSAYRSWLEGQSLRDRRLYEQRRVATQSRLLELVGSMNATDSSSENSYALITGASRGIGRALAVELARYRIPLILVARDITKLSEVAQDIEKYYNVPCRVLQADLSSPDAASRIHAATTEAGLKVDILINNAGICSQGEMIEGDTDTTMGMIQVNVGSIVRLSQLYGKDMKERRRGRMLFVSSITGAMPGCATVGVYAATKAFEKSLAASVGREMERYGVGVTCLLPGAVRDTDFASRSDVETAVCFQIPGYAKTPELVAGEGIKAMMLGYPECYPGWENRFFAKIMLTHLPARVAGLIGEYAWSPWPLGMMPNTKIESKEESFDVKASASNTWKFRRPAGNVMRLPELPKIQMPKPKPDGILLSDVSKDATKVNGTNIIEDTISGQSLGIPIPTDNSSTTLSISPEESHNELLSQQLDGPQSPLSFDDVEVDSLIIPESNETWYPSMLDLKEYDFRDRRLDY